MLSALRSAFSAQGSVLSAQLLVISCYSSFLSPQCSALSPQSSIFSPQSPVISLQSFFFNALCSVICAQFIVLSGVAEVELLPDDLRLFSGYLLLILAIFWLLSG